MAVQICREQIGRQSPRSCYGRLCLCLHHIVNELHDIEDFLLGAPQREAEEVSEGPI